MTDAAPLNRYIDLARELGMTNAVLITPQQMLFDRRAVLKCLWGCDDMYAPSVKCSQRGTTFEERVAMAMRYQNVLLVHAHDARQLSQAVLEIERQAFLDGNAFAFALRCCNLCPVCNVLKGGPCPTPEKIRPCDQGFGIDVYGTVASLGLPIAPLRAKDDLQNRYGFVLLN
ncbi:MAG: DUF2284 domain-containing protein [Pseudomonadota bacterium]